MSGRQPPEANLGAAVLEVLVQRQPLHPASDPLGVDGGGAGAQDWGVPGEAHSEGRRGGLSMHQAQAPRGASRNRSTQTQGSQHSLHMPG